MGRKVVFLGMGGTIAGRSLYASDNVGYLAAQLGITQLLECSPALATALRGVSPETEQVAQVDSKDMDWAEWRTLYARAVHHLQRDDVGALVITHGTDTLEETAYFLSQALPADLVRKKPVVITCAMRPSTSSFPDGPQNLCDAAEVANSSDACGVLVSCAGVVHCARDVQKIHPYRLDAFSSGDVGPAGWVEEGHVRWARRILRTEVDRGFIPRLLTQSWPRVEIVMNSAGMGGAAVRSLCAAPARQDAQVKGIVVAGTGNGTVNQDMELALAAARAQGIRVVITTRCLSGQIVDSREKPVTDSQYQGLSVIKARIALVLELLGNC